ncbi:MAG TPA: hypothetical protein PLP07_01225 [Pyrinomonadaceae bacterium]|nr:hypothetical protein [Chloracidobacterium sp.]MBP9936389.1 hypothetical protein [Pyrinomonadaceae bacterium]MBL0240671.1 hypothetical protein [Chloracidobacterium sp.]HQX54518.1 hypothetical protein [Pyrinomonadaceae bacterium]HQY66573.1 hypothetical protein [Pyrinomonadaceae bacterium]
MKFLISFSLAVLLSVAASAQSTSAVLKQAEKALGSRKTLLAVSTTTRTGTIKRVSDGVSGKYIYRSAQPNLLNIAYDLDGFEIESGSNGRSGWKRNSRDGLQTLTGVASVEFQAKAAFRGSLWLNAKKEKSKIVSGGRSSVGGKQVNVVNITTAKGLNIKLYFDALSGLLLRDEMPAGDAIETTDYSDYRAVSGTMQPFEMKLSSGGEAFEITLADIAVNRPIDRAEFDFPTISGAPLPDIKALLDDLRSNEDRVEELLDSYSYTQKSIKRELGKDGVLRETGSETYQLSFYKGNRIRRLIEKNGRALNIKEQADEDKEAGKRVEEIEREIAKQDAKMGKQGSNGAPSEESRRISTAEVLRASKLTNPRRERFRGRDVIVFDFEPDPNFDFKNAKSMLKFFGKTAGVMWIDEKDKQVARLEAVLADSFKVGGGVLAKLRKGASFTLEQERVNNEIWLPSQADINLSVRVLLVKGIEVNQLIRSYDYRQFQTEVKDATVNDTPKP